MTDIIDIKINKDDFKKLLKAHLNLYYGQAMDKELIDQLTGYVTDSLELYLNGKVE